LKSLFLWLAGHVLSLQLLEGKVQNDQIGKDSEENVELHELGGDDIDLDVATLLELGLFVVVIVGDLDPHLLHNGCTFLLRVRIEVDGE